MINMYDGWLVFKNHPRGMQLYTQSMCVYELVPKKDFYNKAEGEVILCLRRRERWEMKLGGYLEKIKH